MFLEVTEEYNDNPDAFVTIHINLWFMNTISIHSTSFSPFPFMIKCLKLHAPTFQKDDCEKVYMGYIVLFY